MPRYRIKVQGQLKASDNNNYLNEVSQQDEYLG